ncbi:hypothetical protein JZ751_003230 [Albula glossodonta]|uniref:Uncharacterized protein n=1 Tax=Albula glossodonta TaxID=121402 RepID=A0A8T2NGS2_9TELE|nr:hypothetical protein JZ751_003230 [Albula glossodonta]
MTHLPPVSGGHVALRAWVHPMGGGGWGLGGVQEESRLLGFYFDCVPRKLESHTPHPFCSPHPTMIQGTHGTPQTPPPTPSHLFLSSPLGKERLRGRRCHGHQGPANRDQRGVTDTPAKTGHPSPSTSTPHDLLSPFFDHAFFTGVVINHIVIPFCTPMGLPAKIQYDTTVPAGSLRATRGPWLSLCRGDHPIRAETLPASIVTSPVLRTRERKEKTSGETVAIASPKSMLPAANEEERKSLL